MKIRLSEIADRAGVSPSTVSRVLNDKPGVSDQARRSVLVAVDVLGYDRPSKLRPRTTGLVGLVIPELDNPFFPRFAQQIELQLVGEGYTPLLCSQSLGGIHEDDYVQMLLEHGVSGIIFVSGVHAMAGSDPQRYLRLTDRGLPIVCVNGHLEGIPGAFISNDDTVGTDLAVAHLANMGHTRIGLALGQRRYTPVVRKEAGFRAAMRSHVDPGLADGALDDLVVSTTFTVEGGALAAGQLLDRGVTAIVSGSDVMALGVLRAARQRDLDVPGDLSVVGYDDSLMTEFAAPPMTTVRQPSAVMAAAACRALVDQIGGVAATGDELLCEPELIVRASTGRAPR